MYNRHLFEKNLLALSSRHPQLAKSAAAVTPSNFSSVCTSRTGLPVPFIEKGGRQYPLHSTFDPLKEAKRLYQQNPKEHFLIFFGLGGGYHIAPYLENKNVSYAIIIEREISHFAFLLSVIDFHNLFLDPRVFLLVDVNENEIKEVIISKYVPPITGDISTVSLRSQLVHDEPYFLRITQGIKEALNEVSDDYTVQTHFGKTWFKNTIVNLATAEISYPSLGPVRKAIITGAGPSLEMQIPTLLKKKKESTLIATDTSLPALLEQNILPDIVISIDCQHISYHHFISGLPKDIPLILDLASPPVLTRLTKNPVFFSSGHPFSRYVSTHWRPFPTIDTSGGNVSHAAISLADFLGAKEIYLFGLDFSFPQGKSYARGTYLYKMFGSISNRTSPEESLFFQFLLRNENITLEKKDDYILYTTKPMISYKERLEKAASSLSSNLVPQHGMGVPLNIDTNRLVGRPQNKKTLFAAGKANMTAKSFLESYKQKIRSLSTPYHPFAKYFQGLDDTEKEVWFTMFPATAKIRKETGPLEGIEILDQVRNWSLEVLKHTISSLY